MTDISGVDTGDYGRRAIHRPSDEELRQAWVTSSFTALNQMLGRGGISGVTQAPVVVVRRGDKGELVLAEALPPTADTAFLLSRAGRVLKTQRGVAGKSTLPGDPSAASLTVIDSGRRTILVGLIRGSKES